MATSWRFGRVVGDFDPSVFFAKNAAGDALSVLDSSSYDDWSPKPGVMKWVFELRGTPNANPGDIGVYIRVPIPIADLKTYPSPPLLNPDHNGPSRPIVLVSPMNKEFHVQQVIGTFSADFTDPQKPMAGADITFGAAGADEIQLLCVIDFSHSAIN